MKIQFDTLYNNCLGAEEEVWTVDKDGQLTAASEKVFKVVREDFSGFVPELPAVQIELRSSICRTPADLDISLHAMRNRLRIIGSQFGFKLNYSPIPPNSDFDLSVYPKERYLRIAKKFPPETLKNAWIAGLHVHVGCLNIMQAIDVLNQLRSDLPMLLALSARSPAYHTDGQEVASERFFRYIKICENPVPPYLVNSWNFEKIAEERGFADELQNCWWLARISRHGTVEVRVFDLQEEPEHSAQIASLVQILAILYKKGREYPWYFRKGDEEIFEELKQAATCGRNYTGLGEWINIVHSVAEKELEDKEIDLRYLRGLISRLGF